MAILNYVLLIALCGGLGGLANCFQTAESSVFPSRDEESNVGRPGWLGTIFTGSIAAVAMWCIYGPLASFDVFSGDTTKASLTLAQLGGSLVVGFSGGKILTLLAQHKADQIAKDELTKVSKKLAAKSRKQV